MSTLFRIESVTAGYEGKIALRDVTMAVEENDFIGIIGPNGGGKTTLLKVILGLLKPLAGRVDYSPGSLQMNQIGYMPQVAQGDTLFPVTVEDVVLSGLMHGRGATVRMGRSERRRAAGVMDELGLTPLAHRALNELSGGQLQRVYLARAISGSPRLLLLDEPATFVDTSFEADFYDKLKELNSRMTIMMVSHDVGMVSAWVKSFACVNEKLFYHPHSKITQDDLRLYGCPIQLVAHGDVPHVVLHKHE